MRATKALAILSIGCQSAFSASGENGESGGSGGADAPDASTNGLSGGGGSGGGSSGGGSGGSGGDAPTGGIGSTATGGALIGGAGGAGGTPSGGHGGSSGSSNTGGDATGGAGVVDAGGGGVVCGDAEDGMVSLANDEDPTDDSIYFDLYFVNGTADSLSLGSLEIRYYFTSEPTFALVPELQFAGQYDAALPDGYRRLDAELADGGIGSPLAFLTIGDMPEAQGADHYASITFAEAAGTLSPSGEIELAIDIHAEGYSQDFIESDDQSYLGCSSRTTAPRVVVFKDGVPVFGTPP